MADIRPPERMLDENVTWNKARRNFLAKFTRALIQIKAINLVRRECRQYRKAVS